MNKQPLDGQNAMTIYLGNNWVLVASIPGDYQLSEALAPSFVASTDPDFKIRANSSNVIQHESYLLRYGEFSAACGKDLFYLYVDPVAPVGLAIQSVTTAAVEPCKAVLTSKACQLICNTSGLAHNEPRLGDVQVGVESLLSSLSAQLHATSPDGFVQEVANFLKEPGKLAYKWSDIGLNFGISPDYLRQQFSRNSGITLSGYRYWLRFRLAIEFASETKATKRPLSITELALAAGFYDAAHCARFVRKSLGQSLSSMMTTQANFVDCRTG